MDNNPASQTPQAPVTPVTPQPSEKHNHVVLPIIVGVVALFLGLGGGYFLFGSKTPQYISTKTTMYPSPTITQVISPTEVVVPTADQTQSFPSPNGKYRIKTQANNKNGEDVVLINSQGIEQVLYSVELGAIGISVGSDSWSKTGKYFFAIASGGDAFQPLIFNADGSPFSNGKKYLDIKALLAAQGSKYTVDNQVYWLDDHTLAFASVGYDDVSKSMVKGPNYTFNVETQTLSTK